MASPQRRTSLYSLHPGFAREEAFEVKLKERTGKTLQEWIALVQKEGPPTEKERRVWLKAQHDFTTNYAWWVAERAEGRGGADDYDPEALVEAMYAGPRAGLRPLYDRLLKLGLGLGKDVKACPCKTIVPLYRQHVFAEIKPATNKRIDLGFALQTTPATGRLIHLGARAQGNRITHRIPLTSVAEIDDEVKRWLRAAYDLDAGKEKT
jgi:hypothetical protein